MPTPPRAKAPPHVQAQAQAQAAARSQRRLESTFDVQATTIPPGLFGRHTTHINAKSYVAASSDIRYFLVDKSRAAQAAKDKATALGKSMVSWSTILATPTADTPGACLYLHHDNRRYLFGNISEGTQRLMVQRKVSLTKTEEIFVTGPVTWHNVGGLLGMVLSIAEGISSTLKGQLQPTSKPGKSQTKNSTPSKPPSVGVHGAENLAHMIATARRFVFRKGIPIRPREARADPRAINPENHAPDWQDENIKVWYVPLYAEGEQRSTRKRDRDTTTEASDGDGERTLAGKELVDSVVNHMFDSDWQFDALFETTLHQAQLPATLFVKDAQGHLKQYDGPLPGSGAHVKDIPVLVRKPWPGATVANLPRTTPVRQSMCYIVKNHPRRGKFNPQAAQKYGVAKQDYKVLTSGGSVQGADGTLVTPDMVVAATVEGNGFAMVDIPDPTYISSLLARPEWTTQEIFKNILTINWLLGPGVLDDPRLQDFMAKHTSVRHTVFSSDTCPNHLALESPAVIQIKLHRLDPDRFPIPRYSNVSPYQEESRTLPIEIARPGATVSLAPQAVFKDDNIVPFLDTTEALNTLDDEIIKLADAARAKIADKDFLSRIEQAEKDIPSRDAEVIPLGTGSAVPSKYRNVSSTLVRVPGHGSYIFDAGENTLGSLKRLYGPEGAQEVLRDLKLVWISHLHADHHLGTASVIRGWRDATAASEAHKDARLSVASHWQMLSWLREYADVEDYGFDRLRLLEVKKEASSKTAHPLVFSTAAGHQDVSDTGGLARIDAAHVDHCFGAYAVALTWPSGLKVAYSGDCRPSDDFVRIGRGATLLIHESTFDDGLEGEAKAKKHSTMGEALDVARRMGARRVLLTHFSQRYPKIPIFDAEPPERDGGGDDMAVLIAFDLMRVKLGEFRQAAAFLPALQGLLNEEEKKKDD